MLGKRTVDLRHASAKHLIAPGSPAGTVVQALRHLGAVRATDVVQVAIRQLSGRDKKMLAASAVQAPAWMRPTLVSIANTIRVRFWVCWTLKRLFEMPKKDAATLIGGTFFSKAFGAIRRS